MFLEAALLTEASASAAAIAAVGRGEPAVLLAGADEDAAGYLVAAAAEIEAETVAAMSAAGDGRLCAAMAAERIELLEIPPMPRGRGEGSGTGLFVGVDHGGRGGSDQGRAATLRALADQANDGAGLSYPGHIFAVDDSYGHPGLVAAAIDMMLLARREPVAALTELSRPDEGPRPAAEIVAQAAALRLPVAAATEIAALRAPLPTKLAEALLPTSAGRWRAVGFRGSDEREHLALVRGGIDRTWTTPVYVHRACLLSDALGSLACDCGQRLEAAAERISELGNGVIVYLTGDEPFEGMLGAEHQAGRGSAKAVAEILTYLGVRRLRPLGAGAVEAADLRLRGFEVAAD